MELMRPTICALALLLTLPALAADGGCEQAVDIGDKPTMDGFVSYDDFLVAVMAHKAKEEAKRKHQKMCPELYLRAPLLDMPQGESLDRAVQQSKEQAPFDYSSNQTWYNRSTSRSFGLPDLANDSLAGESIHTSFLALEDGPMDETLRGVLLTEQSPLDGLLDGRTVVSDIARQTEQVLREREVETILAFQSGNFTEQLVGFYRTDDGRLTLFVGETEFLAIQSTVHIETCLSSCDEFAINLSFR